MAQPVAGYGSRKKNEVGLARMNAGDQKQSYLA